MTIEGETVPSPRSVLADLPQIVSTLLHYLPSGDRIWQIVERRYGLGGAPELTFEELAAAFQLSRERIRQLDVRASVTLRSYLLGLSSPPPSTAIRIPLNGVPTDVPRILRDIINIVDREPDQAMREDRLLALLGCDRTNHHISGSLALILRLADIDRIIFLRTPLEPIYFRGSKAWGKFIEDTVLNLHHMLASEGKFNLPQQELDVLMGINSARKSNSQLQIEDLRRLLPLCSTVERTPDGRIQACFHHIEGRGNQALRVLSEHDGAMNADDIAREINTRTVPHGKRHLNVPNLTNQMSSDGRFVALGKSGYWDLKARSESRARTVLEHMEKYLASVNTGATADDIYEAVKSQRPVSRKSIDIYLRSSSNFAQVSRGVWRLASWPEAKTARTWSRAQVAEWIAQTFQERKTWQMDFSELKLLFVKASGLSSREAAGLLGHSPFLVTKFVRRNKLVTTFTRSIEHELSIPASRKRPRQTLLEQVGRRSRDALQQKPRHEMALADLVALMVKEFKRPKATFYNYIARLDCIETFSDELGQRRCRLRS